MKTSAVCPVCKGTTRTKLDDVYDDRFGYAGMFALRQCTSCGHRYLDVSFNAQQLARLHGQLSLFSAASEPGLRSEEQSRWSRWWNAERSVARRWVPRDALTLDVWCRFGEALVHYKARGMDGNARRVTDVFAFDVHSRIFEAGLYGSEYFDHVTLDHVVEHSSAPARLLAGAARVLKPGGSAVLSCANPEGILANLFGRRWLHWEVPYRLQFFTKKSMCIAAREAGLHLESTKTITDSQWISLQWWHLLSRPPFGSASPFWTWPCNEPLRVGTQGKRVSLHQRLHLNNAVTRALDALGMGDNRIYVLRKGQA